MGKAGGASDRWTAESYAKKVSSLVDAAKLATLGKRATKPRVQKYVALLAQAKEAGLAPKRVANYAVELVGMVIVARPSLVDGYGGAGSRGATGP